MYIFFHYNAAVVCGHASHLCGQLCTCWLFSTKVLMEAKMTCCICSLKTSIMMPLKEDRAKPQSDLLHIILVPSVVVWKSLCIISARLNKYKPKQFTARLGFKHQLSELNLFHDQKLMLECGQTSVWDYLQKDSEL